jgi:predicted extracellular nuclease
VSTPKLRRPNTASAPCQQYLLAVAAISLLILSFLIFTFRSAVAAGGGSINISALGVAVTENFNSLATSGTSNSTLPNGFFISETGTSVRSDGNYAADDGASTTGDTYSYGTAGSTDRALGTLRSSTLVPIFGASFTNNTGSTVTSLTISYTGEQWRLGTANRGADRLDFQYSTNATSITSGTYTDVDALDFSSPVTTGTVGKLDGNAAANRTTVSSTISNLNIAPGSTFFIRWTDFDAPSSDDGLAVDDFSLTANGNATPSPSPTPTASPSPSPTPAPTITPIYQIQGSGSTSPFAGQSVTTMGVVTGIKAGSSGGFFIQDPTGDGDPTTSDAVFVFTGSAVPSSAAIGNNISVTGTVVEFRPSQDLNSPPLTEISSAAVNSVLATGQPLPAPVTITAADTNPSGTLENLERYEGMRVTVASLTVVAPTQGTINEPNATATSNGVFYGVVTGVARPFREPGINISDPLPSGAPCCVPRFDENPERLRVDSDGQPGTTPIDIPAGTVITNITGPLDFAFRTYTILPDAAAPPTVGTIPVATPVPVPSANELTIASFNMERFFDTINDPSTSDAVLTQTAFDNRLNKASLAIRNVMRTPDVIGVEEVENISTLQAIANKVNNDAVAAGDANPNYQAYLVEGNDIGGIDVGFLVKSSRVTVIDVTQYGKDATYVQPDGSSALLNDRPPLLLRATIARPNSGAPLAFTVIVNHLRSLSGINDPVDGPRVRAKRRAQAGYLANLIQSRQAADPTEKIVSVGDYNSFQVNDGFVDVIGTIKGTPAPPDQVVLASSDLVNPDLTDLVDTLPLEQRYSYSFDGNAQVLDHVLVNNNMFDIFSRFAYARNDADFPLVYYSDPNRPERISDHDMPVAYFTLSTASVTANVSTQSSGLYYSRVSRTYSGTITVTNTSSQTIDGPLQVVLTNLTPGVTLVNANGTFRGDPYVTAPVTSLAPGQSVDVQVRFSDPTNVRIGYTTQVYSGTF